MPRQQDMPISENFDAATLILELARYAEKLLAECREH